MVNVEVVIKNNEIFVRYKTNQFKILLFAVELIPFLVANNFFKRILTKKNNLIY